MPLICYLSLCWYRLLFSLSTSFSRPFLVYMLIMIQKEMAETGALKRKSRCKLIEATVSKLVSKDIYYCRTRHPSHSVSAIVRRASCSPTDSQSLTVSILWGKIAPSGCTQIRAGTKQTSWGVMAYQGDHLQEAVPNTSQLRYKKCTIWNKETHLTLTPLSTFICANFTFDNCLKNGMGDESSISLLSLNTRGTFCFDFSLDALVSALYLFKNFIACPQIASSHQKFHCTSNFCTWPHWRLLSGFKFPSAPPKIYIFKRESLYVHP